MPPELENFVRHYQSRCNQQLSQIMEGIMSEGNGLPEAMKYSLLSGGKRIRPLLTYAAAEATGEINSNTDIFACSVECIHAYSLIHDDLPSMDDDDLRRGKPTNHIQFDEATAILAGDALQCLAFELISQHSMPAQEALEAIKILANASGAKGMVAGQAQDLAATNQSLSLLQLEAMHQNKTGALIQASVVLGALSTSASDSEHAALRRYAEALGLAFQVQDDIIDITSDTATLGKAQGADLALNKTTYVSLLGLEFAKAKAIELYQQAIEAISGMDKKADTLRALAHYVVMRNT